MENIIMSRKEIQRIPVLDQLKNGVITQVSAAKKLDLTVRQVRNLSKQFKAHGAPGICHRNRGRPSKRRLDPNIVALIIRRTETDWKGFGPTFIAEKLEEQDKISISGETIRALLIRNGIWRSKERKKIHRQRRERRYNYGDMVQADGSVHDWFEGRGPRCVLLVFIDDATSKVIALKFVDVESTAHYMSVMHDYVVKHGRPLALYVDRAGVFKVNTNNSNRDKLTQFGRAMKELGIEMIYARTPQAKGRVERVNRTLQDRLIKELRIAGISTIEAANKFVNNYIESHNQKFAVQPAKEGDMHRSVGGYDLDQIFSIKTKRVVQNDYVVTYKHRLIQITDQRRLSVWPKDHVMIHERLDGSLSIFIRKIRLDFIEIHKRVATDRQMHEHIHYKPAADHPWRTSYKLPTPSRLRSLL